MAEEFAYQISNRADALFEAGQLDEAISLYRHALAKDPDLVEAAINLSIALANKGLFSEALSLLERRLAKTPEDPALLNNYGNILRQTGRNEEAVLLYKRAVQSQPKSTVTRFNLAVALQYINRQEEAEAQYLELLSIDPFHKESLYNLSALYFYSARYQDALVYLNRCLKIDPKDPVTLNLIALTFQKAGNYRAAEGCFRRAIQLKSEDYIFHFNLANLFSNQGRIQEAIEEYQQTIKIKRDFIDAYIQLGNHLKKAKRYEEAIEVFNQAIAIDINSADPYNNIGNIYKELGRYEEAVAFTKKAIAIDPQQAGYHFNLGLSYKELFRYSEAIDAYQEAIALKWDYPEAHWNLALILLLTGNFHRGWIEYEWRKRLTLYEPYVRKFSGPQWQGEEDLHGKTILIHDEQGFGDAIQFIRYAQRLKELGAKVIVECLSPLARLFEGALGVDEVITRGFPVPPFDCQSSMLSLPMFFETDLSSIPSNVPYLNLSDDMIKDWKNKTSTFNRTFNVGLAWAGINPPHKSCPLKELIPLFEIENLCCFNLQKGPAQEQLKDLPKDIKVVDFMNDSFDFADTAALMKNLDLIITVDTSIAHLAGALGLPVWVMLHYDADWRWLLDRSDSPWYPTIRLFRQTGQGNWKSLLREITEKLKKKVTAKNLDP